MVEETQFCTFELYHLRNKYNMIYRVWIMLSGVVIVEQLSIQVDQT